MRAATLTESPKTSPSRSIAAPQWTADAKGDPDVAPPGEFVHPQLDFGAAAVSRRRRIGNTTIASSPIVLTTRPPSPRPERFADEREALVDRG